ncbi:unnamed protein product [Mytilus coruscus]|uniref:Fibronectin type-III domain-containing protein n=1 Tax=Mytilus coruscus TaxID=42192 RepID=A0A6J8ENL7_MYTCO|nr:unnamed protein product [Mytilus coruscus]
MNVEFADGELIHGTRYTVCIHADPKVIEYEMWTDELPEVNSCSDGIIVDLTPPVECGLTVTTDMYVNWDSFYDVEEYTNGPHSSGIKEYILGIGTTSGGNDVFPFENVGTVQHKALHGFNLQNGYKYYATIKGLSSLATSWAFQVDTTPPTPGHVYDGDNTVLTGDVKDIDYQTETKVIHVYWEGFHDTHSVIQEYFESVGTYPQCDDILTEQAVGIVNEFTLKDIHLRTGLRYYTTVTACNTAAMCTYVTSDGVVIDNSPPITGHVQDGTGFYDTQYQSMRRNRRSRNKQHPYNNEENATQSSQWDMENPENWTGARFRDELRKLGINIPKSWSKTLLKQLYLDNKERLCTDEREGATVAADDHIRQPREVLQDPPTNERFRPHQRQAWIV